MARPLLTSPFLPSVAMTAVASSPWRTLARTRTGRSSSLPSGPPRISMGDTWCLARLSAAARCWMQSSDCQRARATAHVNRSLSRNAASVARAAAVAKPRKTNPLTKPTTMRSQGCRRVLSVAWIAALRSATAKRNAWTAPQPRQASRCQPRQTRLLCMWTTTRGSQSFNAWMRPSWRDLTRKAPRPKAARSALESASSWSCGKDRLLREPRTSGTWLMSTENSRAARAAPLPRQRPNLPKTRQMKLASDGSRSLDWAKTSPTCLTQHWTPWPKRRRERTKQTTLRQHWKRTRSTWTRNCELMSDT
mmetsp:Transcript_19927/g.50388  ORF Transcript_19927/g.50388 Transcript_19927/m.50388 type:complete len:306 (+) Transcript_19927:293-1210(+)